MILDFIFLTLCFLLIIAVCSPMDLFTALLIYTALSHPEDEKGRIKKRKRIIIFSVIIAVFIAAVTAFGVLVAGSFLQTWGLVLIAGIPSVFAFGIGKYASDCKKLRHMPEVDAVKLKQCRIRQIFFIVMTILSVVVEVTLVYIQLVSAIAYM